ncbi:universal stress protein [Treponema sp.]|uniref:universal stress protein n=1 Tax=Treponema sp. TaxID=166 RepID=UPI00298E9246|nr:universal stress protein [Treponema sp.]MCQ2241278.1 universal stress protein [Treponema sp.]
MLDSLFKKVLVAYNGSKSSLSAVLYAIIMAKLYGCSVKVIYVVDSASIKQLSIAKVMVADEADEISRTLTEDGKKNLEYVKELASQKKIEVETELLKGAVWSEIVRAADVWKADIVLLGGVNDNSTSYSVHENVSRQDSEIIGSAHCSVLVVRDKYISQKFRLL